MYIASKLSSKSQRNKKFGLFVSDMFLQLLNVAEGETSTDIICDLDGNLESTFPRMIERYKNSVKNAKLFKKSDFTPLQPPSKLLDQHLGSKGRLKPTAEKQRNSFHTITKSTSYRNNRPRSVLCSTTKSPQKCTFCKYEDHRVTNFPLKASYGPKMKGRYIVERLLTKAPFTLLNFNDREKIISTDICAKN